MPNSARLFRTLHIYLNAALPHGKRSGIKNIAYGHKKSIHYLKRIETMAPQNGTHVVRKFDPKNMRFNFLGKTGLKVSALSFGSWVTGI
jgi:hypothetical protein